MINRTLNQFQAECLGWQNWNFPDTTAQEVVYGLNEELGELGEAILANDHIKCLDAVGDGGVFGLNYASRMAINIEQALSDVPYDPPPVKAYPLWAYVNLSVALGKINHITLKSKQGIRNIAPEAITVAFVAYWRALEFMAASLGVNFYEILNETWDEVKKRDWKLYPKNGLTE